MWPFRKKQPAPAVAPVAAAAVPPPRTLDAARVRSAFERARACDAAGDADGATQHARVGLAELNAVGVLDTLGAHAEWSKHAGEAFWLLTRAYRRLGAIAYCQRALGYARTLPVGEAWQVRYAEELAALDAALADFSQLDRNADWEAFLSTSLDGERFEQLCRDEGFPLMSERVAFLRGKFDGHSTFNATDHDELLLVD